MTTVGSHDTASAVVGVPADGPALRLRLLRHLGAGRRRAGRAGADRGQPARRTSPTSAASTARSATCATSWGCGCCRSRCATWELRGDGVDLAEALRARPPTLPAGGPRIDPDDPAFLPPGDMPARIVGACRRRGRPVPATGPQVVRCILDSLAAAFAAAHRPGRASSPAQPVEVVHVVGGGSQNALLCQLTADAAGRPVVAGPVEATAIGNLLVQARTHGAIAGDVWTMRADPHCAGPHPLRTRKGRCPVTPRRPPLRLPDDGPCDPVLLHPAGPPGPARGVRPAPPARLARHAQGAGRRGLGQLLALPPPGRPARRLRRGRATWTPRRRRWPRPRSTRAGRRRWQSSSSAPTARPADESFTLLHRGLPPPGRSGGPGGIAGGRAGYGRLRMR